MVQLDSGKHDRLYQESKPSPANAESWNKFMRAYQMSAITVS